MMKSTFITLILTILGIHQAFASDTVHLDIEVNDDGSIKVQPTSGNTAGTGETLELGKCACQDLETQSFPILHDIPIIQGPPQRQETPTNQIVAELLGEMSLDELEAVINNPTLDSDLRDRALINLDVKRMKHYINETISRYNGQTLMDGALHRVTTSGTHDSQN